MDTILGMSVAAFTTLHVAITLIGIAAGFVFLGGLAGGRFLGGWNLVFLVFTILTSVTGFLFHSKAFGPPHVVGVISLVLLAVALVALYGFGRRGVWRPVYAVTATAAGWFNGFVLVTQFFQKFPTLHELAPNGNEPVFLLCQAITLAIFVVLGWKAVRSAA